MILVSVGTTSPFNRLVRTLDFWAQIPHNRNVFAQIGIATYQPKNIEHIDFFASDIMRDEQYQNASLLVCDLSIDVLLPAIELELPVLALPRLSIFGEEIGIEQSTLAQNLKSDDFIQVARDEYQLLELLHMPRMPFSNRTNNPARTPSIKLSERTKKFQNSFNQALRKAS